LEGCHLLIVLLAHNNAIVSLDTELLCDWPLLRRLNLSSNRLTELHALPLMLHLDCLELSDNAIAALFPLAPSTVPQLQHIDLSFNDISDMDALSCLAHLPSLSVMQLHDNPVAQVPEYTAVVKRLLPWLTELDRVQLQQDGLEDASTNSPAAAVAGSGLAALMLVQKLRAAPGLSLGATPQQRQSTLQHWLPALLANGSTAPESAASGVQQEEWDHSTAISLAHQQAVERAALATFKPWPHQAAGDGAAAAPTASAAAARPAWVAVWEAETGQQLEDVGCAELKEGVTQYTAAAQQRGGAAWQSVHEQHEKQILLMAERHLKELLEPAATWQQIAMVHPAYQRRLSSMQAAAAMEAAATALQSAWRGAEQRARLAMVRKAVLVDAAICLQAAWRGRVARMGGQLRALRAAAADQRRSAATVLQAAFRGWRVRQKLASALRAARSGGRGCSGSTAVCVGSSGVHSEDSEDSLEDVPEDFLQLSPALEAELLGLVSLNHCWGLGLAAGTDNPAVHGSDGTAVARGAVDAAGSSSSTSLQRREQASRPQEGASSSSSSNSSSSEEDDDQASPTCCDGSPQAKAAARLDAKLQNLMAEWGFADLATAKAYYKRQQRVLQAQHRHAVEAKLRDPQARLRRLQQQVSMYNGQLAAQSSSARSLAKTMSSPAAVMGGSSGAKTRTAGREDSSVMLPPVTKRTQHQQQKVAISAGSGSKTGRVAKLPTL